MAHLQFAILLFLAAGSLSLKAEVRWGSPEWDRARVVPQGQSQFHLRYTSNQIQQKFGDDGSSQRLGSTYQDVVRFSDLGGKDEKPSLLEALSSEGVALEDSAWASEYELETEQTTAEFLWTKGVTAAWMIGVRVPFVEASTRINAKTTPSESYKKLQEKYQKSRAARSAEVVEALQTQEDQKEQLFAENDWNPIEETTVYRGIGDVELLSQVQLWEGSQYIASFRQRIVAPTGKTSSPYDYIQQPIVDGQTDLGAEFLLDFRPTEKWTLTGSLGFTAQLADNQSVRIPVENQSRLVWEIDSETERDLGDYWVARINSTWRFARRWWALAGVEHLNKEADRYEGQAFSADRYEPLSAQTAEERNLARLGVRVASPIWRQGLVEQSRWFAGVEYITVISGRNTPQIDATSVEWTLTY